MSGLACLLLTFGVHAEVYKWVDADGKTHFGDQKPNTGKSEKLTLPTRTEQREDSAGPASPPPEDYRVRQRKLLDAISEERALKEEQAKKQAERAAQQQNDCLQLKDYLRSISSGRIYTLNNKGERVYDSDAAQTAEINKVKEHIRLHCQ